MPLCDTLLRLADDPSLFRPLWSTTILEEIVRNLQGKLGKTGQQAERRIARMRAAFPEAEVPVPDELVLAFSSMAKEHDRHVVAAAVFGHANAIVTQNLKHFDIGRLEKLGILCHSADDFLLHQFHLKPYLVLEKLDEQAANLQLERADIARTLSPMAPQFSAIILNAS